MNIAPNISLYLDHIHIECQDTGNVVVRCLDIPTEKLSIFKLTRTAAGWEVSSAQIDSTGAIGAAIH